MVGEEERIRIVVVDVAAAAEQEDGVDEDYRLVTETIVIVVLGHPLPDAVVSLLVADHPVILVADTVVPIAGTESDTTDLPTEVDGEVAGVGVEVEYPEVGPSRVPTLHAPGLRGVVLRVILSALVDLGRGHALVQGRLCRGLLLPARSQGLPGPKVEQGLSGAGLCRMIRTTVGADLGAPVRRRNQGAVVGKILGIVGLALLARMLRTKGVNYMLLILVLARISIRLFNLILLFMYLSFCNGVRTS
jgi:hypothetical protein